MRLTFDANIDFDKYDAIVNIWASKGQDGTTLLSAILQPEDRQENIDSW
jgi:hypothetical protein